MICHPSIWSVTFGERGTGRGRRSPTPAPTFFLPHCFDPLHYWCGADILHCPAAVASTVTCSTVSTITVLTPPSEPQKWSDFPRGRCVGILLCFQVSFWVMCVTLLSPFNSPIASIYLNHTQREKKQYAFTTLTMQIVSAMTVNG